MPIRTQQRGNIAESCACDYLKAHGLQCLDQQYRCNAGEIDLIMRDNNTLVFVEVRLRQTETHGTAMDSITKSKQRKIIRAANHYLSSTKQHHRPYRFDVIAMRHTKDLRWIKSAFDA